MNTRIINADNLAELLINARTKSNTTQKTMAKSLGKSIGTIQNWESGIGSPNVIEALEWFEICGLNPLRSFLELIHPDTYKDIKQEDDSQIIRSALVNYISDIASDNEVRKLSFCIFGSTGSSWHSQLEMLTILNHVPLSMRINMAVTALSGYNVTKKVGSFVNTNHIMPDISILEKAIDSALESIAAGKTEYINL